MRIRASACSITCRARHPNYDSDAMSTQKLELTWIGKEKRPKLEPRILLDDPDKSYHATHRLTASDTLDNRLLFGDNMLALLARETEITGSAEERRVGNEGVRTCQSTRTQER